MRGSASKFARMASTFLVQVSIGIILGILVWIGLFHLGNLLQGDDPIFRYRQF